MVKSFSSGNPDLKSDFYIKYKPESSGGIKLNIDSKTLVLHKSKLENTILSTLSDLEIKHATINLIDNGGQYFVLQARLEAAIKNAHPTIFKESLPTLQEHTKYKTTRDRFRRTRLYLPGNQAKLMLNSGIHKPDGIILDLEDSVSPLEKDSARLIVRNALRHINFYGSERMIRINQGEMGFKDLESIIPHNVHLVLVPKAESAQQIQEVDKKIEDISKKHNISNKVYLMPIIESSLGIINVHEIAKSSKNNVAIAIGLEDYTADIGIERTNDGQESLFARCQLINAARSASIQAIDTVFSDVNDENALRNSTKEAKQLGFDGKGCIHPRQIKPIHEEFAPTNSEMQKAMDIVLAFDNAKQKGLGVVSIGSKMIDPPVVKRAHKIIEMAILSGLISKKWKNRLSEAKN